MAPSKFSEFLQPKLQQIRGGSKGCPEKKDYTGESTDRYTEEKMEQSISDSTQIQNTSDTETSSVLYQITKRQLFLQEIMENSLNNIDLDGNIIVYKPFMPTGSLPELPINHISALTVTTAENTKLTDTNELMLHDLLGFGVESAHKVYYITDLHIEHQFADLFSKGNSSYEELSDSIYRRITNMLSSISDEDRNGVLLVGGDVSCCKDIVSLFYDILKGQWYGTVIAILGNHELWDDHPDIKANLRNGYVSRSIDEIIADYWLRFRLLRRNHDLFLLQNALFIVYKNTNRHIIIEEPQLLEMNHDELRYLCEQASLIVLGGLGFSGLDEENNAEKGFYCSAFTSRKTDMELSQQFEIVYDKIYQCAGDMQVVILTHTPVSNWLSKEVNPKWVYINGHTHKNSIIRKEDGTTILSDNQIGYNPIKWRLKSFTYAGWYDPFKTMPNGIHEISVQQYAEFHRGRGIMVYSFNFEINPQTFYVLKKESLYMFILQSEAKKHTKLYLLRGGTCKRLERVDIQYYYDNMEQYVHKMRELIAKYQKALESISNEIRQLGGNGRIHGCIVDIDFYNHIYLNPDDGKMTPYYSPKFGEQYVYGDLISFFKEKAPGLFHRFSNNRDKLPLLNAFVKKEELIRADSSSPQLVTGTDIYGASHIIKLIQFLDKSIIRLWNDNLLHQSPTYALLLDDRVKKIKKK